MRYHPRQPWHLPFSALTSESAWADRKSSRRRMLKQSAGLLAATAAAPLAGCETTSGAEEGDEPPVQKLPLSEPYADLLRPGFPAGRNKAFTPGRPLTNEIVAATHNNFYEFTTEKWRVWKLMGDFNPRPWTIEIAGAVEKPFTFDVEDLVKLGYEERAYRFRCVEAWAMAVPWTGVPLRKLIAQCRPLGSARFVTFTSFHRPEQALGQRRERWWPWPYYEALRIDEATHDLALLATGIYGHALPRQHGAPARLVVPWKYGFKSIKSITKIAFTERLPRTFWNDLQPAEYAFEANVNPKVAHPRWSQAKEKMIGTDEVYKSRWLNGYAEQLGELYPKQPIVEGWDDASSPWLF
jgi:sulfoxide reductase catalytic subunit YedY